MKKKFLFFSTIVLCAMVSCNFEDGFSQDSILKIQSSDEFSEFTQLESEIKSVFKTINDRSNKYSELKNCVGSDVDINVCDLVDSDCLNDPTKSDLKNYFNMRCNSVELKTQLLKKFGINNDEFREVLSNYYSKKSKSIEPINIQ